MKHSKNVSFFQFKFFIHISGGINYYMSYGQLNVG